MINHYVYLAIHLADFFEKVGLSRERAFGMGPAHGDKAYCYRSDWEKAGIPFPHGVAIFMLSYCRPFRDVEVNQTPDGWVDVGKWVISKYPEFKKFLPEIEEE